MPTSSIRQLVPKISVMMVLCSVQGGRDVKQSTIQFTGNNGVSIILKIVLSVLMFVC